MLSVDLTDAYSSIPIAKGRQKNLILFIWRSTLKAPLSSKWFYICSQNIYKKLSKTVFLHIRKLGHKIMG